MLRTLTSIRSLQQALADLIAERNKANLAQARKDLLDRLIRDIEAEIELRLGRRPPAPKLSRINQRHTQHRKR
jgi:hypothetical protein